MATIGRARHCAESQINNPLPRALYDEVDEKETKRTSLNTKRTCDDEDDDEDEEDDDDDDDDDDERYRYNQRLNMFKF